MHKHWIFTDCNWEVSQGIHAPSNPPGRSPIPYLGGLGWTDR